MESAPRERSCSTSATARSPGMSPGPTASGRSPTSASRSKAMTQVKSKTLQGIRIPPAREARRHRTLDERILVRFPALVPWLRAAIVRLPRHSRLRRAMLVRSVRQGYAAVNRRDFDLARTAYDPDCEYHPEQAAFPDAEPVYYGRDGLFRQFWGLQLESF